MKQIKTTSVEGESLTLTERLTAMDLGKNSPVNPPQTLNLT